MTLVEYRSTQELQLLVNDSTFSTKLTVNKLEFDVIKNSHVHLTQLPPLSQFRLRYMKLITFYLVNISKALVQLLKRHKKISKGPLKLGLVTRQL